MTTADASPTLAMRIMRGGLVLLLFAAAVWVLVLSWWHASGYAPGPTDAVLHLAALPLALFSGYILLRNATEHLRSAGPGTSQTGTRAEIPAPAATQSADEGPLLRVRIVSGYAVTAASADTDGLLDALAAARGPEPDGELEDGEGFPVFAARIPDLPPAPEALPPQLGHGATVEQLRALAALERLMRTAARDLASRAPELPLRLLWLQPADWPEPVASAGEEWLHSRLPQFFESRPSTTLDCRRVASGAEVLRHIDGVILELNGESAPSLRMLACSESLLGEHSLQGLAAGGELFTATRGEGRIPGEAAAAIVLSGRTTEAAQAADSLGETHLACALRRPAQATNTRDGTAQLLGQLIDDGLARHGLAAESIAAIGADIDQRAERAMPLHLAVNSRLPQLDPLRDCVMVGSACGHTGPVAALLALLVAVEAARDHQAPSLAVFLATGDESALSAVVPPSPPSDAATGGDPA